MKVLILSLELRGSGCTLAVIMLNESSIEFTHGVRDSSPRSLVVFGIDWDRNTVV